MQRFSFRWSCVNSMVATMPKSSAYIAAQPFLLWARLIGLFPVSFSCLFTKCWIHEQPGKTFYAFYLSLQWASVLREASNVILRVFLSNPRSYLSGLIIFVIQSIQSFRIPSSEILQHRKYFIRTVGRNCWDFRNLFFSHSDYAI